MNSTDLYSSRIQKTYDDDQLEIVSILLGNPNTQLKLTNYYKGLPLSYPATIASVGRGTLDLEVKAEQAFVIEKCRCAFIRSPLFKHDVFAQVQYINVKKMAATFVKFCYVEIMAERRNFIRIVPEPLPEAVIESPLGIVEGELQDISLSGVNVAIDHSCPLQVGSEMPIRFLLTGAELSLGVRASVPSRLVAISGDALPRDYQFSITPDRTLERQLSQYIIQRQIEIIREIKTAVQ